MGSTRSLYFDEPEAKSLSMLMHMLADKQQSPIHETELVKCIKLMAEWGWGFSSEEVKDIVQDFVSSKKLDTPFVDGRPERDWLEGFLSRHSDITPRKTEHFSSARASAEDPKVLKHWFDLLDNTLTKAGVKDIPCQIFNTDETTSANSSPGPSSPHPAGPSTPASAPVSNPAGIRSFFLEQLKPHFSHRGRGRSARVQRFLYGESLTEDDCVRRLREEATKRLRVRGKARGKGKGRGKATKNTRPRS
ncbi:hypothetical protein EGW08_004200 [Elysia chlorotica]|uniref:HTH CENPB-type domain-containing protein n=1 Tax=Elysia chlorotica TaxID=188477 RepID=A0A3S1BSY3_ELYCH|nr:hypothetical protein EGW08_004200 [Elysia chlorotica]